MIIYPTVLYIKQHSVTGLKYFGKTTGDPYKYNGSGVHWKHHIKKHGKEHIITTWVSEVYTDSDIISEFALKFSRDNNIVESNEWANLILENGLDGMTPGSTSSDETKAKLSAAAKGRIVSEETKAKLSAAGKGRIVSEETKAKLSIAHMGQTQSDETKAKLLAANKGKARSDETKAKISAMNKGKVRSEEYKAKISAAKKGKPWSEETRAKRLAPKLS